MEGKNHKSPSKFMTCILVVNDLILCATLLCNFRKENDHYKIIHMHLISMFISKEVSHTTIRYEPLHDRYCSNFN